MRQRTVGIMGGMGPSATVDFTQYLVSLTANEPIRLLVDCNPTMPDVSCSILGTGPSCAESLVDMAQGLERAGSELIVLACNAAHHYQEQIRLALAVPFISMIEAACAKITRMGPEVERVGLLAARSCLVSGVYQRELAGRGKQTVLLQPRQEARFDAALADIRAGRVGDASRTEIERAIATLADAGSQAIILGCTEIALVMDAADAALPSVDPGKALAEAVVDRARQ